MARGRQKNYEERLATVEKSIAKLKDRLSELQKERTELLREKKEAQMNALLNLMDITGLSVEEVSKIVKSSQEKEEEKTMPV